MRHSVKHFTFDYEYARFGVVVSTATVSVIDLPNGKDLILLTYTDPTVSSKTATVVDEMASRLVGRLGLDPENVSWAEHYPLHTPDRIDLVSMKWAYHTKKYFNPYWAKAPNWMASYIFEALKQPIEYPLTLQPDINV